MPLLIPKSAFLFRLLRNWFVWCQKRPGVSVRCVDAAAPLTCIILGQKGADLSASAASCHKQQPHARLQRQSHVWELRLTAWTASRFLHTVQTAVRASQHHTGGAQTCQATHTSDPSCLLQSHWELQGWSLHFSARLLLVTWEGTSQLQPHQRERQKT